MHMSRSQPCPLQAQYMKRATEPSGQEKGRNTNTYTAAALTAANSAMLARTVAVLDSHSRSVTSRAGTIK